MNVSLGYFLKSWWSRVWAEHPVLTQKRPREEAVEESGTGCALVTQCFPRESLERDQKWPEGPRGDSDHTRGSRNGRS